MEPHNLPPVLAALGLTPFQIPVTARLNTTPANVSVLAPHDVTPAERVLVAQLRNELRRRRDGAAIVSEWCPQCLRDQPLGAYLDDGSLSRHVECKACRTNEATKMTIEAGIPGTLVGPCGSLRVNLNLTSTSWVPGLADTCTTPLSMLLRAASTCTTPLSMPSGSPQTSHESNERRGRRQNGRRSRDRDRDRDRNRDRDHDRDSGKRRKRRRSERSRSRIRQREYASKISRGEVKAREGSQEAQALPKSGSKP